MTSWCDAEVEQLAASGIGRRDDPAVRAARLLDAAGSVLALAGLPAESARVRRLRDRCLDGELDDGREVARFGDRVGRRRALRWVLGGLTAEGSHGGSEALRDRLTGLFERARAQLDGEASPHVTPGALALPALVRGMELAEVRLWLAAHGARPGRPRDAGGGPWLTPLSLVYAAPVMVGLAVVSLSVAGLSSALEARDRGLSVRSGLMVPLRETARLMRQRPRRTVSADRLLWRSASSAVIPLAVLIVAFVPLGAHALVDHPLGLVWVNALDVVAWAVMWLLGWGANSVTGLVGGYRFLALALGYELPLMFALTAPAIAAGSLDLAEISAAQDGLWFVVWAPVAFAAYCWGVLGFSVRPPMDPGAGIDVNGGILAELAGVDRLLVLAGRYALLVAGSAAAVPLFLGGGAGPLLPGWGWVLIKTILLSGLLVLAGRRLPTLRPDKLLELGWVVVLPLVVAQDLVVSVIAVATN